MAASFPDIHAKASLYQMLDKLGPIDADEFRKCVRFIKCVVSWFDISGLPCNRETIDVFSKHVLSFVEAGEAPPFSGQQAEQVCYQTLQEIVPQLSDQERDHMEQQRHVYSTRMVSAAPPEIQDQFALLVAQQWAKDLL